MGRRGGKKMTSSKKNGGMMGSKTKTYFSVISAAQEVPGRTSSALGNAIATVQDDNFCIKLSYDGLSGPELFSHDVHGPAAIGEISLSCSRPATIGGIGPFTMALTTQKTQWFDLTMALTTQKTQCFELTKDQMKDLDDELWYFNIHNEMCPGGEIRGQILPL
jgi:hypothetical protein